jgi:hypothetical protein
VDLRQALACHSQGHEAASCKYRRRANRDIVWQSVFERMWVRCRDRAIAEALMGIDI